MTREEALKIAEYRDCQSLVERIYDDIESRICENCKYRQSNHANDMFWCINQDGANKYRRMDIMVDLDFGCNKFEVESR